MPRMLTPQEHSCLKVTGDWKAPFGVAKALYPNGPSIPQRKKVAAALRSLHDDGLLVLDSHQNTYKRTPLGDAIITGQMAYEKTRASMGIFRG